jgi:hypothetical protein
MTDGEDVLDCMMSVDEMLSEAEEALEDKNYSAALHKIKEARDMIEDLREDDESLDDRQEVDMHVTKVLK